MMLTAVRVLAVALWLWVLVIKTPALGRLMAQQMHDRDPQRVLLWFYAASQMLGMIVAIGVYPVPVTHVEGFARIGTHTLSVLCALGTLWLAHIYRDQ